MNRYSPTVAEGDIIVETDTGTVKIGPLEDVLELLGGPAWTISYTDWEKRRYPDLDTSDEGITIDIVDFIHAMSFDDSFIETLGALPADSPSDTTVSPRLGLFLGRLLENLAHGVQ